MCSFSMSLIIVYLSTFRWKVKVLQDKKVFSHFLVDSGLVFQDSFTISAVVYKIKTVAIKSFSETRSEYNNAFSINVCLFVWCFSNSYFPLQKQHSSTIDALISYRTCFLFLMQKS